MNPMIEALRKNRTEVRPPESEMPGGMGPGRGMGGDMAKYWQMIQDMNSKMDKIMSVLGINGDAPEKKEMNNDDGKPGY